VLLFHRLIFTPFSPPPPMSGKDPVQTPGLANFSNPPFVWYLLLFLSLPFNKHTEIWSAMPRLLVPFTKALLEIPGVSLLSLFDLRFSDEDFTYVRMVMTTFLSPTHPTAKLGPVPSPAPLSPPLPLSDEQYKKAAQKSPERTYSRLILPFNSSLQQSSDLLRNTFPERGDRGRA